MTIRAQQQLNVGDRFIERTPTGRELAVKITAVDVEPKYRHGYQGRFVEMQRDPGGQRLTVREQDILSNPGWMRPDRSAEQEHDDG